MKKSYWAAPIGEEKAHMDLTEGGEKGKATTP